jgi:outer membrane immunogenic protein
VVKKSILAATLATATVASGAAVAADLPRGPSPYYSPAPAPSPIYNWGGVYAGVNLGYQWGDVTNSAANPSGVAGGGQVGYNWQSGQLVFGAEADLQVSGADDTFAPWKFSNPWFGTVRGRLGYAFNNILLYGTVGFAYGDLTAELAGLDETKTEIGWTGGLGVEYGFNPNWSAKLEYLYLDLANRAYALTGTSNGIESSLLRVGLNYHF